MCDYFFVDLAQEQPPSVAYPHIVSCDGPCRLIKRWRNCIPSKFGIIKKKDDEDDASTRRENKKRSWQEEPTTPLLNDVPRPAQCDVCGQRLGIRGQGEEVIEWNMVRHLERAGFKTKLRQKQATACGDVALFDTKYWFIVCKEHYDLHQEQKKMWTRGEYPSHGWQDPARGPYNDIRIRV